MGYYVTVESGVKIFVEDLNPTGKKTIFFIHGWPLNHNTFEYQYDVLPAMGYRCIGIDWRGYGKSDKPYTGYTYDRLADDVRAVIAALKLENITLLGHSTGGGIAIRYMARYQGYGVSKLILVDAAAPTAFTKEEADQAIMEIMNDRPNFLRGIPKTFFFQNISGPFADWFFQMGLEAAGWATAGVARLLGSENLYNDLFQIKVPTLIIHGIHDEQIPFSQAEEVHRIIKSSQLVPFMFSGHGTFWEERGKFNALVAEFVGS